MKKSYTDYKEYEEAYEVYRKEWEDWNAPIKKLTQERDNLSTSGKSNSQIKKRRSEIFNLLKEYRSKVLPPEAPEFFPAKTNAIKVINALSILSLASKLD